jgi:hypothetical protein
VHALWKPTDTDAIVIDLISPAGFEGFFEEMGALRTEDGIDAIREVATRYGQTPHPELIQELSERYGVSP